MGADTVTLTSEGHAQKLQVEMARMREQHALCDITIQVSGGIEYAVHKVVLVTHSRYFRMQMDCGQLHGSKHIISSVDSSMFAPLLAYLYTGQLHITSTNIWAIITAATQLDMPDALNLCERYLQNTIKPDDESPEASALNEQDSNKHIGEERGNASLTSNPCTQEEITESKVGSDQQQPGYCPIPKLKIDKRKLLQFVDHQEHDAEGSEEELQSEVEDSEWKPNGDSKGPTSRKKRKQRNPQKVVSQRRGMPKNLVISNEKQPKICHRKWISRRQRIHKCLVCRKSFAYRAMLKLHQESHNHSKSFLKTTALWSPKIDSIQANEQGGIRYCCRLCQASHKFWSMADSHRRRGHMQIVHCEQCSYSCYSYRVLYQHRVLHHGAKRHTNVSELYRCNTCPSSFKFQRTFLTHIETVHNRAVHCEKCGTSVRPAYAREKHLVSCYRITVPPSIKVKGTRVSPVPDRVLASGSTDMRCSGCSRVFKYQKAFTKHMLICSSVKKSHSPETEGPPSKHRQVRKYECRKCQDQFPHLKLLQEHQDRFHPSSQQYFKSQIRRPYTKRCKNWDCEVDRCNFKSTNPHVLTKHVKQHHPDHLLPCNECRFAAGAKSLLERHIRTRHVHALQCDMCSRSFSVPAQLRVHKYIKHKIDDGSVQVHPCPVPGCNYTCVWKSSLKVHMQRHEIEKPFTCQICDKKFKREKGVEKHINKVHKGIRPYMCDICGQSYGEEAELKAHIVRHDSNKQYKCEHCDYATHDKGNYQSHLFGMHQVVISNDMTIFKCNVCDYTTDRKHRYEMHMKNHMGIRDITCKLCGKGFVTKNTLSNHIQRVHSEKTYTCVYCQYTTGNQHTYKEHVRVMHTHRDVKPYKCAYCDFRCHTSGNCRKHCANRHKGMEIKWVRLCELNTNESSNDGNNTMYVDERPLAESNIKHISIARRISKDVLNQQQQHEQEQLRQLEEQQIQEQQQPQQVKEQQLLPGISLGSNSSFTADQMTQGSLPTVQLPLQQITFEIPTLSEEHQALTQLPNQAVLQIPHLPMSMVGSNTQDAVSMNSLQQPLMSFGYSSQQILLNQQGGQHGQHSHQGQKHLTLL